MSRCVKERECRYSRPWSPWQRTWRVSSSIMKSWQTKFSRDRYSITSRGFCSFENFTNFTICFFAKSQIEINHLVNNYIHVWNTHQNINLFLSIAVIKLFVSIHVARAYIDNLTDRAKATASELFLRQIDKLLFEKLLSERLLSGRMLCGRMSCSDPRSRLLAFHV